MLEVALRFIFPNGYYQYRPVPGIHATSEYTYHTKYNSLGVRDREFTRKELENRKILLLGDSMTFGQGIEVEDTFPKIAERLFYGKVQNLLVINGGGKGASTVSQFESLKELVKKYHFDAVGFCFYLGNDADNNLDDIEKADTSPHLFSKRSSFSLSEFLKHESILYSFAYYKLRIFAYKYKLIHSFQGQSQLLKEYSDRGKDGWRATRIIIEEIKRFFHGRNETELFFVFIPQDFQVDAEKRGRYGITRDNYDYFKPNKLLKAILEKNEIAYIDTTSSFINHYKENVEDKLFFKIDRHMNEDGHKLVAKLLFDFFVSRDWPFLTGNK